MTIYEHHKLQEELIVISSKLQALSNEYGVTFKGEIETIYPSERREWQGFEYKPNKE